MNSKGFIDYIHINCHIPKSKITYLPNGARIHERSLLSKKKFKKKVVYAGNIGLAQDVELLMGLAKFLKKHEVNLDIIGYGMKKNDLLQYTKEEQLNNVRFISPKTRHDCLKEISKYQVAVATLNDNEVFKTVLPGKIIDYMTCAVPIVAAVSGYSQKIIQQEEVGLVLDSHDPEDMANEIVRLLKDTSLRNKLAENCISCIEREFLWEKKFCPSRRINSKAGRKEKLERK